MRPRTRSWPCCSRMRRARSAVSTSSRTVRSSLPLLPHPPRTRPARDGDIAQTRTGVHQRGGSQPPVGGVRSAHALLGPWRALDLTRVGGEISIGSGGVTGRWGRHALLRRPTGSSSHPGARKLAARSRGSSPPSSRPHAHPCPDHTDRTRHHPASTRTSADTRPTQTRASSVRDGKRRTGAVARSFRGVGHCGREDQPDGGSSPAQCDGGRRCTSACGVAQVRQRRRGGDDAQGALDADRRDVRVHPKTFRHP
jgi:hypothetical protein